MFALGAAIVVFATRVAVLDHGIANHHLYAGRHGEPFVFEGAAVQQDGVIGASEAGGELVHDANPCANKFIFGTLTQPGNFNEAERMSGKREKSTGDGNFESGG